MKDFLCEDIFLTDLLGSQNLLETFHTSFTVKCSEHVVKCGCFEVVVSSDERKQVSQKALRGEPNSSKFLPSSFIFSERLLKSIIGPWKY